MAVSTLRRVFRVLSPSQLAYHSFDTRGNRHPLSTLGLPHYKEPPQEGTSPAVSDGRPGSSTEKPLGGVTDYDEARDQLVKLLELRNRGERSRLFVQSKNSKLAGDLLFDIINSNENETIASFAATRLAELPTRAFDVLAKRASGPTSSITTWALMAFADLRDPQVPDFLIAKLNEGDRKVRWEAIRSLGSFPEAEGGSALAACLQDPDRFVRSAAIRSIGDSRDPAAFDLLAVQTRDEDCGKDAWDALERFVDGDDRETVRVER